MVDEQHGASGEGGPIDEQPERAARQGVVPASGPAAAEIAITPDERHLDLKRILGVTAGISGASGLRRRAT